MATKEGEGAYDHRAAQRVRTLNTMAESLQQLMSQAEDIHPDLPAVLMARVAVGLRGAADAVHEVLRHEQRAGRALRHPR